MGEFILVDRIRGWFGNAALAPVLVLWGFGYLLVGIFATLLGRMDFGLSALTEIPLFLFGVAFTLLLDQLRARMTDLPRLVRLAGLGAGVAAVTALHTLIDLHWYKWLALNVLPDWRDWALAITQQRLFTVGLLYLWTFCLAMTLLWATRIGQAAERSAARATRLEAKSQKAEATALRLQLNPHFLFNTLNSISSLVTLDRKEEAEEMIGQLSDFLRASLISDPSADVTLGEEIATIESYLAIESQRFGSRMEVDIDVPDALLGWKVPNFILQPLVENAIKHGAARSRAITAIRVKAAAEPGALRLSVVNRTDGGAADPPAEDMPKRQGIGIANIRQRLAIAHGAGATLDTRKLDDGYEAVISLPRTAEPKS